MSQMIPAKLMVASSLLLAPGLALTMYGQNSPQTNPPATAPADAPPPALCPARRIRSGFHCATDGCENAGRKTRQH